MNLYLAGLLFLYTSQVYSSPLGTTNHKLASSDITQHPACPTEDEQQRVVDLIANTRAEPSLVEHGKEFDKPEILEITDGVWFAIGYCLANTIIIKAPSGLIIIDTMDSEQAAARFMADLRQITTDPVAAIIYTHSHADHMGGAKAIINGQTSQPEVWAYKTFVEEHFNKYQYSAPLFLARNFRALGIVLRAFPGKAFINSGLGPYFDVGESPAVLEVLPNQFLEEDQGTFEIAGMNVSLLYIPGETKDQMGVYIPSLDILCVADDYYKTFPNLYSIRGTPARPVKMWYESIDKLRSYEAGIMLPAHTRPVFGKEEINLRLTQYRDAIQFVFDQTIRYMNKGMHPDEIAEVVQLPQSLNNQTQLLEHYGRAVWSVKTVFESQMGWFSGAVEELLPLTPSTRGQMMMETFGTEAVLTAAREALDKENYQWALELASHVWNAEIGHPEARKLRTEALTGLAGLQSSPNSRNYLLVTAIEENCIWNNDAVANDKASIEAMSIDRLFLKMSSMLKAELTADLMKSYNVFVSDMDLNWRVNLRNSVLEVKPLLDGRWQDRKDRDDGGVTWLSLTSEGFRSLLLKTTTPADLLLSGDLKVREESLIDVIELFDFLEHP